MDSDEQEKAQQVLVQCHLVLQVSLEYMPSQQDQQCY